MALLTVRKESALTEAGNSVLMSSVCQGNFGFCACILHVTRHSRLTRLAQKFGATRHSVLTDSAEIQRRNSALARKLRMEIVSAEFGGKQSHEIGP